MHPPRRLVPLVLGTALLLLTTACGHAATEPAAAHVAGTDVTDAELAVTAGVFESLFGLQHAACGQKDGADDTAEAACNRYSLGAMIQFRLVQDYASKNSITVADAEVQKAIDGFEAQVGKDTLAALLTTNNVTHDDFTQLVRLSLLENQVASDLATAKVDVGQLRTGYQQNPEQYTTLTVDHILVKTKAEADNVYQQVTRPGATRADFLTLAKQVSIDSSAAQNSGALPATPATKFVKPFADAALAMKPDDISRPVHTPSGWHVIHLVDKQVAPFAQVRDQALKQAQANAFSDWVRQQDQAGAIDVDPSFGRFDPSTLQVVRITSTDPSATAPPASGSASPS
ncbi:MAG: peptidylprolyl isomerase [Actinomycetota bacterium]|nr:peptidylprolyl isomerase [Actinomycetota bacterium]